MEEIEINTQKEAIFFPKSVFKEHKDLKENKIYYFGFFKAMIYMYEEEEVGYKMNRTANGDGYIKSAVLVNKIKNWFSQGENPFKMSIKKNAEDETGEWLIEVKK